MPYCGAWTLGLYIIASATSAYRETRRHHPRTLTLRCPNSSNLGGNLSIFSRIYGAYGALTLVFWDSGVQAPSVQTVAF